MVIVVPAKTIDVERDARSLREALEAVRQHLGAQVADLLALEAEVDDAKGPVG